MNNHEKKSIAKSIRITPSVYDAILSFDGEGFNDKLCNLVNYSIHYIDELNKEIETKKQKLSALETESSRKLKELNNLNNIADAVHQLETTISNAVKRALLRIESNNLQ